MRRNLDCTVSGPGAGEERVMRQEQVEAKGLKREGVRETKSEDYC